MFLGNGGLFSSMVCVSGARESRSWESGTASAGRVPGYLLHWAAPGTHRTSRCEQRSVMGRRLPGIRRQAGTASPPLKVKGGAELGFSLWTEAWKSPTCSLGTPLPSMPRIPFLFLRVIPFWQPIPTQNTSPWNFG